MRSETVWCHDIKISNIKLFVLSFLQDTKFENQLGTTLKFVYETILSDENLNVPSALLTGKKFYVVSNKVTQARSLMIFFCLILSSYDPFRNS